MIIVYSKPGCQKCASGKEKLRLLGLAYGEVDIATGEPVLPFTATWRDNGVTDARAYYEDKIRSEPEKALPLFMINGIIYSYSEAMKILKK